MAETHWPGPLTLVLPTNPKIKLPTPVSFHGMVAVRVSSNPIARAIASALGGPLVATSANRSGKGECYSIRSVLSQLKSDVSKIMILNAGRLPKRKPSTLEHTVLEITPGTTTKSMTPTEIQQELAVLGLRSTRIRGQHFLIDDAVLESITEAAQLTSSDTVVEIGPGLGVLTGQLVAQAGCVVAVELDHVLAGYLRKKYYDSSLVVVEGDARQFENKALLAHSKGDEYKVVANIPYNITSELLQKFLERDPAPSKLVLLIQREVGERINATPPHMNRLAVLVQYFGVPEIIRKVSREAFWPPPKVESVVVRIRRHSPAVLREQEASVSRTQFFSLVKAGFSSPRKKLAGNLSGGLSLSRPEIEGVMEAIGIDKNCRAETVAMAQWLLLAKHIFKNKTPKKQ